MDDVFYEKGFNIFFIIGLGNFNEYKLYFAFRNDHENDSGVTKAPV